MASYLMNPQERTRFFRFAVVGVIGAVVDFGTMNLLAGVFAASLIFAGTISFIAAILSNFTWNRYWTYPDSRSKSITGQLIQFTVVSAAGLLIRIPILAFIEPLFHKGLELTALPTSLIDISAKNGTLALAIGIVMFWNFFINRYWTYNDVS